MSVKIYTRQGDTGYTDLFGGLRVSKANPQVKAYGDLDLANTAIGLAYSCAGVSAWSKAVLLEIMKLMFSAGAEIATAPKEKARILLSHHLKNYINDQHISRLENLIDEIDLKLAPQKSFILPCGNDQAARLHWARTMVRKSEISLVELAESGHQVRLEIIKFINRLSDLLFMMARLANWEAGDLDLLWNGAC